MNFNKWVILVFFFFGMWLIRNKVKWLSNFGVGVIVIYVIIEFNEYLVI